MAERKSKPAEALKRGAKKAARVVTSAARKVRGEKPKRKTKDAGVRG